MSRLCLNKILCNSVTAVVTRNWISGFQVEKFVLKAGAKHCSPLFLEEELDLGSSQPITHRTRALLPMAKKIQGWHAAPSFRYL